MRSGLLRLIIMSLASSLITSSATAYMIDDDQFAHNGSFYSGFFFADRDCSDRHYLTKRSDWKTSYNGSEEINGWNYDGGWQTFSNLYDGIVFSSGNFAEEMDWGETESNDDIADNMPVQIDWNCQGKSTVKDFSDFWFSRKYRKRCHHHSVPIPGSALMLGPGLIGLAVIRIRLRIYKYS